MELALKNADNENCIGIPDSYTDIVRDFGQFMTLENFSDADGNLHPVYLLTESALYEALSALRAKRNELPYNDGWDTMA